MKKPGNKKLLKSNRISGFQKADHQKLLWSSFFVTLVAKKIVLINLCCRPCFIWGSITIITVWTNMIIINVCKFFYLHIAKLNGRLCGAKRPHSVSEQPNFYQSLQSNPYNDSSHPSGGE